MKKFTKKNDECKKNNLIMDRAFERHESFYESFKKIIKILCLQLSLLASYYFDLSVIYDLKDLCQLKKASKCT